MMKKYGLSMLLALAMSFAMNISTAAEAKDVHGLWKLVGHEVEVQSSDEKMQMMGKQPKGYVLFMPEGRVFFMFAGDGRQPAKTDAENAALMKTLVAYTGSYRIDGDTLTTKPEVSWDPRWEGTQQTRTIKIIGNRIQITTEWRVMPNWPDKGMSRSIVTVERVQ